jgi:hypothetical protein
MGPGTPTLHRHWHRAALGREPLASPAAPADGPGPHQHLRLTARRTPHTGVRSRSRLPLQDRRRVGSACAPSIGTSTGPDSAGGCSPAPRRQRASLVSCGTLGSRSFRWVPRHPATSSDTRAMRIVRGSRGGRQCTQAGTRAATGDDGPCKRLFVSHGPHPPPRLIRSAPGHRPPMPYRTGQGCS